MRWEDERYIRLYTRDTTDWLALSFDAQALLCLLLRKVDRAGLLPLGRHGKRGVAIAIGHPREWERLAPTLEELLADGCVRLTEDGGTLLFPNFIAAQETAASDKARQRKSRETAAAVAASQSRDVPSRNVTPCHDDAGAGHAESHDVTPSRAVPCCAVPFSASQATGVAAPPGVVDDPHGGLPDATDDAQPVAEERPPLVLDIQQAGKKPRRPSAAEELFARLEARRKEKCEEHGVPFVETQSGWPPARINRDLGPIARAEAAKGPEWERFCAAWWEFLDDPAARQADVPLALDWFWKARDRYFGRSLKAAGGGA